MGTKSQRTQKGGGGARFTAITLNTRRPGSRTVVRKEGLQRLTTLAELASSRPGAKVFIPRLKKKLQKLQEPGRG